MGLTFSRSVKAGPVRFNLSGAGIGVSFGIPGLRIGTGPRGAYISGGRGGFRYRKSLGHGSAGSTHQAASSEHLREPDLAMPPVVDTVVHDAKSVLELTDSSSDALLQSMNEQRKKWSFWPLVAIVLGVLFLGLLAVGKAWPAAAHWAMLAAFVAITAWVRWRDKMRKVTVLFFEPDETLSERFETVLNDFRTSSQVQKLLSIAQTSTYSDTKYTGGANQGIRPGKASFRLGQAPDVLANIDVPILVTNKTTLAFFPDRLLAFQGRSVGAVAYADLTLESVAARFIERERVPSDATVVDHTWQYVNKKGGPDKRFKDNKQYPVCLYNELHLTTSSGLDIQFMGSKDGAFEALAESIGELHCATGAQ